MSNASQTQLPLGAELRFETTDWSVAGLRASVANAKRMGAGLIVLCRKVAVDDVDTTGRPIEVLPAPTRSLLARLEAAHAVTLLTRLIVVDVATDEDANRLLGGPAAATYDVTSVDVHDPECLAGLNLTRFRHLRIINVDRCLAHVVLHRSKLPKGVVLELTAAGLFTAPSKKELATRVQRVRKGAANAANWIIVGTAGASYVRPFGDRSIAPAVNLTMRSPHDALALLTVATGRGPALTEATKTLVARLRKIRRVQEPMSKRATSPLKPSSSSSVGKIPARALKTRRGKRKTDSIAPSVRRHRSEGGDGVTHDQPPAPVDASDDGDDAWLEDV